ncbi:Ribosome small subunit-stimulated GTPase EngC [Caballeronia glathei]|jgi:ribosome biogenesis GTPase|uniref:Small ribosomal subunit biogenesis GTPase RsgA n=1 Tax=Caballeronia glathei TaxID=60547 RepID=A0A069PCB8_9BURK|nr:ribosome small subunit-dependent GTPase A [Caballeronia glathei]KDR38270.1 GTPase RsgA [Caballeronia glathei]CDY73796.1 Ribosome small subunit-stimulated GTPase EngC [Caballeronia glathei]
MTARGSKGARAAAAGIEGTVIAAHGRHYLVAPADGGAMLQCFPRGKRSEVAVGDRVTYERSSADQGVIVRIGERRNLLYRSDQFKSKLFAANLDQLLIVLATEPHFSEDLLGRALIAAEAHELEPLIVLNKIDVEAALPFARKRLAPYRELGYTVIELSAKAAPGAVHPQLDARLKGRATLLLGQSGMGKSTLVNILVPDAEAATREISTALNSGRHTTTFTRLYPLPGGGSLIDSPGFQEFGLHHLSEGQLERAFADFRPFLGKCRFYNCHHLHEPGCAILEAVDEGKIAPERHALYAQLVHEASQIVR